MMEKRKPNSRFVGYDFKFDLEDKYIDAIIKVIGSNQYYSLSNFKKLNGYFDKDSKGIELLRDSKLLDIWFEPVYMTKKEQIEEFSKRLITESDYIPEEFKAMVDNEYWNYLFT